MPKREREVGAGDLKLAQLAPVPNKGGRGHEGGVRAALSFVSGNGAVVARILDRFGFGFKIYGPLAKLLTHFIAHGDPLQLAASLSHVTEFACIHGACSHPTCKRSRAGAAETSRPAPARDEVKRREPCLSQQYGSVQKSPRISWRDFRDAALPPVGAGEEIPIADRAAGARDHRARRLFLYSQPFSRRHRGAWYRAGLFLLALCPAR